jgi:RNA polymerase sigma-70 factor, ECF subfamily
MAESVETRDLELLRRLTAGDEAAFSEFYQRHQGGLYRYAMHMSGSPQSAADVVQETFLTLVRYAKNYDEKKGAPAAFLFGIARNHLRKLQEREGRYAPLSDDLGRTLSVNDLHRGNGNGHYAAKTGQQADMILEDLEQAQTVKLLREAILTLPEHYREPVTLCDLEGKSYGEAAVLLDCPVGTVRSRLNRARSMLLDKLRAARLGIGTRGVRSGGGK